MVAWCTKRVYYKNVSLTSVSCQLTERRRHMRRVVGSVLASFFLLSLLVFHPGTASGNVFSNIPKANVGTSYPATQEILSGDDASSATQFGFNLTRTGTASSEYGDAAVLDDFIGVMPSELFHFGPTDKDGETADIAVYDLASPTSINLADTIVNTDPLANNAGRGTYVDSGAAAIALDINNDGIDEVAVLTVGIIWSSGDQPDTPYLSVYGADGSWGAGEGAVFRRELSQQFFAGSDDIELMTLGAQWLSNVHQLAAGDFDGNGYDDLAVLYYGASEPILEIHYFAMVDSALACDTAGWDLSSVAGATSNGKTLMCSTQVIKYPNPFSDYNGFNGASLAAGDIDGNGSDEIAVSVQFGFDALPDHYRSQMFAYKTVVAEYEQMGSSSGNVIHVPRAQLLASDENWSPTGLRNSMNSLVFADVDADGIDELVVGGCVLGATVTTDYNMDDYYLCYLDTANGVIDFEGGIKAYTEFPDASMGSRVSNYQNAYLLYGTTMGTIGHNGDFTNWSVPMASVNVDGFQNGRVARQIFFGDGIYRLDGGQFARGAGIPKPSSMYDWSESVQILLAEAAVFESSVPGCESDEGIVSVAEHSGIQSLVLVCLDAGNGDVFTLVYTPGDSGVSALKSEAVLYEKPGNTRAGLNAFALGNFSNDDDSFFLKLVDHEFVYSEPTVESVIIAPPYFQDVYDAVGGYDSGTTTLTAIDGETDSLNLQGTIGFDFEMLASTKFFANELSMGKTPGFQVQPAYNSSVAREVNYGISVSNGQDSVVMTCVPMDLYYYEVYRPGKIASAEGSGIDPIDRILVKNPSAPATLALSFESYDGNAILYNQAIEAFNAKLGADEQGFALAKLPMSEDLSDGHKKGYPETYKDKPAGFDESSLFETTGQSVYLDHGNDFGTTNQSVSCALRRSDGYTAGVSISCGFKLTSETRLSHFDLQAAAGLAASGGHSDVVGSSYAGSLNSIPEEWGDYRMALQIYAGVVKDAAGEVGYKIVGYTASDISKGLAIPRSLKEVESEATTSSVTLELVLPWDASNACTEGYVLQRLAEDGTWTTLAKFENPNTGTEGKVQYVDAGLSPGTTYHYRATAAVNANDSDAASQYADAATVALSVRSVSFNPIVFYHEDSGDGTLHEAAGFMMVQSVGPTMHHKSSLANGGKFLDGSQINVIVIPFEGYAVDDLSVVGAGGASVTPLIKPADYSDGVYVAILPKVSESIELRCTMNPAVEVGSGSALVPGVLGGLGDWGISFAAGDTTYVPGVIELAQEGDDQATPALSEFWSPESLQGKPFAKDGIESIAVYAIELGGLSETYDLDGPGAADGIRYNSASLVELLKWESGKEELEAMSVSDGSHLLLAIAKGAPSQNASSRSAAAPVYEAKIYHVQQCTEVPDFSLEAIGSSGNHGLKRLVVTSPFVPSRIVTIELAPGQDASSGFETVYQKSATEDLIDASSESFAIGSGSLKNGWYTVRVTTGSGLTVSKSIKVTNAYGNIGTSSKGGISFSSKPVALPADPSLPTGPGAPSDPGTTIRPDGPTKPEGDSILAETGDDAAGVAMLAVLAGASLALAGRAARKRVF